MSEMTEAEKFAQSGGNVGMREALLFERLARCNSALKAIARGVERSNGEVYALAKVEIAYNDTLFMQIDKAIARDHKQRDAKLGS